MMAVQVCMCFCNSAFNALGDRAFPAADDDVTRDCITQNRCHRLSLPGGLSLPEAAITIAGTNPNPEP